VCVQLCRKGTRGCDHKASSLCRWKSRREEDRGRDSRAERVEQRGDYTAPRELEVTGAGHWKREENN
jgi:hypothetical protein